MSAWSGSSRRRGCRRRCCRRRHRGPVAVADASALPLAGRFDLITATFNVFNHLPNHAAAAALVDAVAFYPGRVACTLDGERVRPQHGEFYGGWVTDAIVGPFKGEPGTEDW